MHDIAAEIAQEVGVLFENGDSDAGARQQKAEHHAGRPAAGNAARRFDRGFTHERPRTQVLRGL